MRLLLIPLVLLALAALPAPAADSGAALFATHCASCHGPQGRGDGPAAAALDPRPADLTRRPYKNGCCAPRVAATLADGVHGTAMPPFEETLTAGQRQALVEHVLSLQSGSCCGRGPRGR